METAVLEVLSVGFIVRFVFLSWWRFLRCTLGPVFTLTGGSCGFLLRFSRGPLCLWRRSLCTIDWCEDYGRLLGTEKQSL